MRNTPRPCCLALLSAIAIATGCATGRSRGNDGGGGSDGGSGGTLVVQPADAVLSVDGVNGASLAFQVFEAAGGDVTAQAKLTVDNASLGAFNGATFVAVPGAAGKSTVRATVGADHGSTSITLRSSTIVIAPGAPADAASQFGGAPDPTIAPEIVYPPDGVLIPPNLNELEVQFNPGGQNNLFEIALSGGPIDLRIYTKCNPVGGGCSLTPDENTWKLLSQAARGQAIKVTVRGTSGVGVGTSAAHALSFGDDDIDGGLYYWAAASGAIYRYDFGLRGQQAEAFYTPAQGGAICVGCHALSKNGTRIAVGLNAPTPAPTLRLLDVATRKTLFDQGSLGFGAGGSNFEAITPDGSKVITTESAGLTVRDANNGTLIGANPQVMNADMPDVSPDGAQVVFARSQAGCVFGFCMTLELMGASLYTVPFNGTGFGGEKAIVTSGGENNYYPSFSPDSKWVIYNQSSDTSYDSATAKVMAVSATGGTPVELQVANGGVTGNSWPKWAPFIQHFQGATIFWITFSSRRPYGLHSNGNAQIWMVAVDPDKLAAGNDPGYPSFWLPFQDASTGNHIAQWVEKVERQPCSQIDQSGCMSGETCQNGVCVPTIM